MIQEIVQLVASHKTYFLKTSNWLDMVMIFLSNLVLLGSFVFEPEDFKRVRALFILIMAAQTIQIVSKISFLSMSLHMAIFKKVCKTFVKTIALYFILILAFAMSFYTLHDQNSGKEIDSSFGNHFMALITTVRMMLSDFEQFKIESNQPFRGALFLVFMLIVTIILFNLLNALAITDTSNIIKDAELVNAMKQISILNSYDKILNSYDKVFNNLGLQFARVFPRMTRIVITPNQSSVVRVQPPMKYHETLKLDERIIEKITRVVKDGKQRYNC
jgi:hypothetical protein